MWKTILYNIFNSCAIQTDLNAKLTKKCPLLELHSKPYYNSCMIAGSEENIKSEISYIPLQLVPFPKYPSLHLHVYEPPILLQVAFAWQGEFMLLHSLTSEIEKRNSHQKQYSKLIE